MLKKAFIVGSLALGLLYLFCFLPLGFTQKEDAVDECEKAGGTLIMIQECDGSQSPWCVISAKEQCYADQVRDGKCTVGEYSEELNGIVGITPRVLCDTEQ